MIVFFNVRIDTRYRLAQYLYRGVCHSWPTAKRQSSQRGQQARSHQGQLGSVGQCLPVLQWIRCSPFLFYMFRDNKYTLMMRSFWQHDPGGSCNNWFMSHEEQNHHRQEHNTIKYLGHIHSELEPQRQYITKYVQTAISVLLEFRYIARLTLAWQVIVEGCFLWLNYSQ